MALVLIIHRFDFYLLLYAATSLHPSNNQTSDTHTRMRTHTLHTQTHTSAHGPHTRPCSLSLFLPLWATLPQAFQHIGQDLCAALPQHQPIAMHPQMPQPHHLQQFQQQPLNPPPQPPRQQKRNQQHHQPANPVPKLNRAIKGKVSVVCVFGVNMWVWVWVWVWVCVGGWVCVSVSTQV